MTAKAICPACGEWVSLSGQPKLGQFVTCAPCETELEVVEVDPVELDWAYYDDIDDDEDWDEEWDDEDEDDDWDDEG